MSLFNREPKVINLAARPKKKPKTKTRVKRAASRATTVKCPTCGKRYSNPVTHVCTVKTDFRRRKATAERQRKRDAAKAKRKAAAERRKAAAAERRRTARARPASRPSQQKHDYRRCRDADCARHACIAFKEGFETGIESCPLPHGG